MYRQRVTSDEQKLAISDLFENTELTQEEIAAEVGVSSKMVWSYVSKQYSPEARLLRKQTSYRNSKLGELNPSFGKSGDSAFHWKGGNQVEDGHGYYIVPKPDWYTGRAGSKYVYQHTVVMCEALGLSELPAGFVIHHVDGDKKNNNINNLALLTNSAHTRLHALERVETIPKGSRGA